MRFAIGQRPQPGAEDIRLADFFMVRQAPETPSPFCGNDASGVIGEAGQNGDFVARLCPVTGELGGARGGSAHLRRKILRNVENFHVSSVVTELECALVTQGTSAFARTSAVCFPAIGDLRELPFAGQTMHHTQLHNV